MAGPLRLLVKMLDDVRSGRFVPDSTRSGRFPEDYVNPEADAEEQKSEASSSSSDGSDNESVVDHEVEEAAIKKGPWCCRFRRLEPAVRQAQDFKVHSCHAR